MWTKMKSLSIDLNVTRLSDAGLEGGQGLLGGHAKAIGHGLGQAGAPLALDLTSGEVEGSAVGRAHDALVLDLYRDSVKE